MFVAFDLHQNFCYENQIKAKKEVDFDLTSTGVGKYENPSFATSYV